MPASRQSRRYPALLARGHDEDKSALEMRARCAPCRHLRRIRAGAPLLRGAVSRGGVFAPALFR
ncbi:hypothetical protein C2I36_03295 [Rhodobacteraceae bacterium WD3A24]|nr:hypothetical protein C2I36_03295 [Rhodobacteraceae bacterium WD3A24]